MYYQININYSKNNFTIFATPISKLQLEESSERAIRVYMGGSKKPHMLDSKTLNIAKCTFYV